MRERKRMCKRQGFALNTAQQSLPFYKWEMKNSHWWPYWVLQVSLLNRKWLCRSQTPFFLTVIFISKNNFQSIKSSLSSVKDLRERRGQWNSCAVTPMKLHAFQGGHRWKWWTYSGEGSRKVDLIKIKPGCLASDAKLVFPPMKIKHRSKTIFWKTPIHFHHGSHGSCRMVEEGLFSFGKGGFTCCPWSVRASANQDQQSAGPSGPPLSTKRTNLCCSSPQPIIISLLNPGSMLVSAAVMRSDFVGRI